MVDRQHDGYNKVNTGVGPRTVDDDGDQNFHSVRAQLLITPRSSVGANIIGDYTQRNENCCVGITTTRAPTAAIVNALAGGPDVGIGRRLCRGRVGQYVLNSVVAGSLEINTK